MDRLELRPIRIDSIICFLDWSVLTQKRAVVFIHFVQYVARPFGKQFRTISVQTPLLSVWVRRADDSEFG